MKKSALWIAGVLALGFLVLTVINASWLAPNPAGAPKQVAQRALAPQKTQDAISNSGDCAARIEEPYHRYLPNTRASILRAQKMGAWMVEVDARLTADGEVVLLEHDRLDCITDGSGSVGETSLDQLRRLHAGYGYALEDDSHPFRGEGARIITLREAIRALPLRGRLMVHLSNDDPALGNAVAESFTAVGRDPAAKNDAFYGPASALAPIRAAFPESWGFDPDKARECTADYRRIGWSGYLPQSCRGATMLIALDEQATLWGWPDRLIARMEAHDGRIVVEGPRDPRTDPIDGITLPEQLTQIPSSFNGYVWTDDAFTTLPALITRFDDRSQAEIDASEAALDRRRAASQ